MDKTIKPKSHFFEIVCNSVRWLFVQILSTLLVSVVFILITVCVLLVRMGWQGAWIYLVDLLKPLVCATGIGAIFIFLSFFQYRLIIWLRTLEEKNKKLTQILLWILYITVAITFWFFAVSGAIEKAGIELLPSTTSTPRPTLTFTPTASLTYTPTWTPTTTIASSPTPASINELNWCNQPETHFPCKYRIIDGDYSIKVAKLIYGNEGLAGLISELYRDEDGRISRYFPDDVLIIPDRYRVQDESYFEYYFHLLAHPIQKCEGDIFSFPCWYVSQGESYNGLRNNKYPRSVDISCIEEANRVIYHEDALIPKSPEVDTVIVLPICP